MTYRLLLIDMFNLVPESLGCLDSIYPCWLTRCCCHVFGLCIFQILQDIFIISSAANIARILCFFLPPFSFLLHLCPFIWDNFFAVWNTPKFHLMRVCMWQIFLGLLIWKCSYSNSILSYTFSGLLYLLFEVLEQPEATLALFQFEKIESLSVRTRVPLVHSYCSLGSQLKPWWPL